MKAVTLHDIHKTDEEKIGKQNTDSEKAKNDAIEQSI